MSHFSFSEQDLVFADAGYGTVSNYVSVREKNTDVLIRISPNHLVFYEQEGEKLDFLSFLEQEKKKGHSSFEKSCYLKQGKKYYWVRLIIGTLPKEKAILAQKRKKRIAQRKGSNIKKETLVYAGYVILITSLGVEYDREEILELYRHRWQMELLFKRIKQNFKIRTIRAGSEVYALTLIYLWLILWLITEKQVILMEQYLQQKRIHLEQISIWELSRACFSEIKIIVELSWGISMDTMDIFLLASYLATHKSRRKNQNRTYQNYVKDSLIA